MLPLKAGQLNISNSTNPADVYRDGLRISPAGDVRGATAGIDHATNSGFSMTSQGQLVYLDTSSGALPVDTVFVGGFPFSAGALCISTLPPDHANKGIPFTLTGAVSAVINA